MPDLETGALARRLTALGSDGPRTGAVVAHGDISDSTLAAEVAAMRGEGPADVIRVPIGGRGRDCAAVPGPARDREAPSVASYRAVGVANAPAQGRTHVVVGDQQLVCSALERARADGRLVRVTGVAELPEGRVRVTAQLRDSGPPPGPAPRRRRLRRWLVGAAVLVAVAAATALVWLLVVAVLALIAGVTAVVTWVSAHHVVIGVVLGVVLVLACSAGAKCAGLHCGGCRG